MTIDGQVTSCHSILSFRKVFVSNSGMKVNVLSRGLPLESSALSCDHNCLISALMLIYYSKMYFSGSLSTYNIIEYINNESPPLSVINLLGLPKILIQI